MSKGGPDSAPILTPQSRPHCYPLHACQSGMAGSPALPWVVSHLAVLTCCRAWMPPVTPDAGTAVSPHAPTHPRTHTRRP
jgi:hypothetical protein